MTNQRNQASQSIVYLPLEQIQIDPAIEGLFPKDPVAYQRVKESIAQVGILSPLLVQATGEHRYTLLAGHHRLAAARELGMTLVPCQILHDVEAVVAGTYDNVYRRQLPEDLVARYEAEAKHKLQEARAARAREGVVSYLLRRLTQEDAVDLDKLFKECVAVFRMRMPEPDLRKVLAELGDLPHQLGTQHAETQAEIEALRAKLAQLQDQLHLHQQEREAAEDRIAQLQAQLNKLTATEAADSPVVKELRKDLEEAHRHRVDFSKKLAQANTELTALREQLAQKDKRLQVLEQQAIVLRRNEEHWREQWRQALTKLVDPEMIARDCTLVHEALLHLRECLESVETWPAEVHQTVEEGLRLCEDEIRNIRGLLAAQVDGHGEQAPVQKLSSVATPDRPPRGKSASTRAPGAGAAVPLETV
jgi:ParB-like chromosome segregation protein Spo0J